jgi:hypothetical protein
MASRDECWACGLARGPTARLVLVLTISMAGHSFGGDGGTAITLREVNRVGDCTRVQTELKANGLYRPGLPPQNASVDVQMPKPLAVEIETRFVFNERIVASNRDERAGSARIDQLSTAVDQS